MIFKPTASHFVLGGQILIGVGLVLPLFQHVHIGIQQRIIGFREMIEIRIVDAQWLLDMKADAGTG